ncbi:MAG: fatty acid desaturase family protein [Pseudomonadota bacterium]
MHATPPRRKLSTLFSKDEIAALTERSDAMGWRALLLTWGVIALVLLVLARWPHPLVWVAALLILGGRQLSLAIMMHDAAHGTLFRTRWLNEVLADYACASAVGIDLKRYRQHHLGHHANTGSAGDPDSSLSAPFPTSRASLARKLLRDLAGISGIKRELGLLMMHAGLVRWTVANEIVRLPQQGRRWPQVLAECARNVRRPLAFHAILLALLAACGKPWLYLAWLGAYLSTYSLFMRIRSIAEHACTEPGPDMLRNTRSTRAGWLARATVAPLRVNLHIEHHVMPAVPYFRLPAMHALLRARGVVEAPPGYLDVLKLVSRP